VQEPKYDEELVGILYMKPHAIIVNEEYDRTLATSCSDPNHGLIVGKRPGGVKVIERLSV